MTKQNRITVFLFLLFSLHSLKTASQVTTISGYVRDVNTHRVISNVNIFIKDTKIGATTNVGGKYRLQVRGVPGDAFIVFQHIAYDPLEISLKSLREKKDVYLQPRVIPLQEAIVEEKKIDRVEIEKDLPQTVALIKAQNFEIRGFVDAGDLLRTDHSIQVDEELSGKKTIAIRGGNPDEVLVLYNGIKMNSAYDNVFDFSLIDLENVERFEIIKGSNTALYGPEAFSGVINIVPKIQRDYNIRFQQRMGTYRSGNWGLHLHHKYKGLSGSYSFKQGGMSRNFADMPSDRQLLENFSEHHSANVNYNFSELPSGEPINSLGVLYIRNSLNHENHRDLESLANFNELLSLKYTGDIGNFRDFDLSLSAQQFEEEQSLTAGTGALFRNFKDRSFFLDAKKNIKVKKLEFLLGYQFQYDELDFLDERNNFQEIFVGLESAQFQRQHHGLISITKLHGDVKSNFFQSIDLDLSLRYDKLSDKQLNPVLRGENTNIEKQDAVGIFENNDWSESTIKFALALPGYRDNLIFNSYISFGINKRFPTLLQQISSPAMFASTAATTNLNPEKNTSTELSLVFAKDFRTRQTISGWKTSGNFFQNQYDNKFRISTTPGIPIQFYDNVATASISGFETKSSVFFFKKKVAVELGLSRYFISEKSAFPFKSDFKRTMNLSLDHAGYSFQVHWFKEGEQIGWFRQPDGYFAEISLPEYSNIDLHISKTFHVGKLRLFANASGRNLLDDGEMLLMGLMIRDRRFYITLGAQY